MYKNREKVKDGFRMLGGHRDFRATVLEALTGFGISLRDADQTPWYLEVLVSK